MNSRMEFISASSLPPGFGFHPTDVELICHYLKRKILGHKVEFEVIPEVDIYKHEPWDLPAQSRIPTGGCKWHFFTSRDRKYPNGSRSNRATEAGYWKSTGKDRNVRFNNRIIGTKKTLVFHEGKPPYGKRTDWIMHEYYLNENECKTVARKDIFVLCRVTKRNGLTKEEEKLVSIQVENNIRPCALPGINCPKEIQDVSVCLLPKKEVCSPSENVDDLEAWLRELYDPTFCADPLTEPKSEDKGDAGSLDVKHDLEDKCFLPRDTEETDVSAPEEHGVYDILGYQFNAYGFDDNLFGLSNSEYGEGIYSHEYEPVSAMDYPSHPGYAPRCTVSAVDYPLFPGYVPCTKDEVLTKFPTASVGLLSDHERMVPGDSKERISTLVPDFSGLQDTVVDTGIQIRERPGRYSNEVSTQRIRLQVHKMESRNPGPINQTCVFVSEDTHLDSMCELNRGSIQFKAKADPDLSGALTNCHQMRAQLQEMLTHENSSSAPISQHEIKSRGRISESNKPEVPSSKSDCKLGPVYSSMLSMLHRRKLVEPCNPCKLSPKPHSNVNRARGFLRGIRPFLCKCSLVGLNCLFLGTCMIGTATLIGFFLVRDARRFLGSSHAFDL